MLFISDTKLMRLFILFVLIAEYNEKSQSNNFTTLVLFLLHWQGRYSYHTVARSCYKTVVRWMETEYQDESERHVNMEAVNSSLADDDDADDIASSTG